MHDPNGRPFRSFFVRFGRKMDIVIHLRLSGRRCAQRADRILNYPFFIREFKPPKPE